MKKKNLLMTVVVVLNFATITVAQVPNYVPTNGLVGWWGFNGNANDESGNGNNGTVNGATLTTDRFGNTNSAYDFDGVDDWIDYSNPQSLQLINGLTYSAWLNPDGMTNFMGVIGRGEGTGGSKRASMMMISTNYEILFELFDGNVANNAISVPNAVGLNEWNHVACTWTGQADSSAIKIYINAVLILTVPGTISTINNSISDNDNRFKVGSRDNLSSGYIYGYFDGRIDDCGVWNRALSPCEVQALYSGQITSPSSGIDVVSTCTSYQWIDGNTYTQSTNTPTFVLTNTQGCDSTVTLDLTISQPPQPTIACYENATFNTTTCQWDVTGTQPTQPTTACYETATFNTTTCQWDVTGTQTTISQPTNQTTNINTNAQFVVGSSDTSATFQWQTDLGVGFQNLNTVGQYSGANTNTLTVSNVTMSNNNQPFRCIISSGSCSDTSNVAVLNVNSSVGINETPQENLFSVFPNPAQSLINVKADSKLIGEPYTIFDNTGRVVLSGKINSYNTVIELTNISGGNYLFSVGENLKQNFKIIKSE